jgi:signal transduction histidine kinase
VVGLVLLARDFATLRRKLVHEVQTRTSQLAQIGMGLAHEIRNPLHALRINVHTLRRSLGRSSLSEQQLTEMMRESDDEINQLDSLMRDFVQYMVPQTGEVVDVDLAHEVQATLNLLGEELRRKQVELKTRFSQQPATVHIDPARLRQIVVHLLTFAQKCAGSQGTIEVRINQDTQCAELVIADSGSVLAESDQARLFEPYQATAHSSAGLGLALIHRFVLEAGGSIVRQQGPGQNCFRLLLPLTKNSSQGTQS